MKLKYHISKEKLAEKYEYLNVPEEYSFTPKINQKSLEIVRTIQEEEYGSRAGSREREIGRPTLLTHREEQAKIRRNKINFDSEAFLNRKNHTIFRFDGSTVLPGNTVKFDGF